MRHKKYLFRIACLVAVAIIAFSVFGYLRPLPMLKPNAKVLAAPQVAAVNLSWPAVGQAAIGTQNLGLLEVDGAQTPAPIASVAKVITALCVLKQKPIDAGTQGATITLGPADVTIYNQYVAQDGSVVPVQDGEQITQYQALEAMMLPSANNIADSLAIWAFGSLANYTTYANNYVKALGMTQTTVVDGSGFSPSTVGTAQDLVKLAQAALANPTISQIVNESQANIPVAGEINNVNWLLGSDGVIGIKTGNTDQAGGCFMFAAKRVIQGQTMTVVGAIVGDSDLTHAISDGKNLIESSDANFKLVTLLKAGQTVGVYATPWHTTSNAIAQKNVSLLVWQDQAVNIKSNLSALSAPTIKDAKVGAVSLYTKTQTASTPVVLQSAIQKPPISWRLTHL